MAITQAASLGFYIVGLQPAKLGVYPWLKHFTAFHFFPNSHLTNHPGPPGRLAKGGAAAVLTGRGLQSASTYERVLVICLACVLLDVDAA